MNWDPKWGEPADYNVVAGRTELEGFKVGDMVVVGTDNEDEGYYAGDEGIVVGISHTEPGLFRQVAADELIVHFEGQSEPLTVDPFDLQ